MILRDQQITNAIRKRANVCATTILEDDPANVANTDSSTSLNALVRFTSLHWIHQLQKDPSETLSSINDRFGWIEITFIRFNPSIRSVMVAAMTE